MALGKDHLIARALKAKGCAGNSRGQIDRQSKPARRKKRRRKRSPHQREPVLPVNRKRLFEERMEGRRKSPDHDYALRTRYAPLSVSAVAPLNDICQPRP